MFSPIPQSSDNIHYTLPTNLSLTVRIRLPVNNENVLAIGKKVTGCRSALSVEEIPLAILAQVGPIVTDI